MYAAMIVIFSVWACLMNVNAAATSADYDKTLEIGSKVETGELSSVG